MTGESSFMFPPTFPINGVNRTVQHKRGVRIPKEESNTLWFVMEVKAFHLKYFHRLLRYNMKLKL
jgi:hypothetical protein